MITCNLDFQADITVIKNHEKGFKYAKNVKSWKQFKIDALFLKKNEAHSKVLWA